MPTQPFGRKRETKCYIIIALLAFSILHRYDQSPCTRHNTHHPGEYFVPCPVVGAVVTVGFAAPITSVTHSGAPVSRKYAATFPAETLEYNPAEFSVALDTTSITIGTKIVTYVSYSDNQGGYLDVSGATAPLASTLECDWYATPGSATDGSRKLHEGHEHDCDICSDLSSTQLEALAAYDNGGKKIVCDPTCLDGVSDPIHCNCK